jgi:hypothetical protein
LFVRPAGPVLLFTLCYCRGARIRIALAHSAFQLLRQTTVHAHVRRGGRYCEPIRRSRSELANVASRAAMLVGSIGSSRTLTRQNILKRVNACARLFSTCQAIQLPSVQTPSLVAASAAQLSKVLCEAQWFSTWCRPSRDFVQGFCSDILQGMVPSWISAAVGHRQPLPARRHHLETTETIPLVPLRSHMQRVA